MMNTHEQAAEKSQPLRAGNIFIKSFFFMDSCSFRNPPGLIWGYSELSPAKRSAHCDPAEVPLDGIRDLERDMAASHHTWDNSKLTAMVASCGRFSDAQ